MRVETFQVHRNLLSTEPPAHPPNSLLHTHNVVRLPQGIFLFGYPQVFVILYDVEHRREKKRRSMT